MYLLKRLALAVVALVSLTTAPHIMCMDNLEEQEQTESTPATIMDLPPETWSEIFKWLNADLEEDSGKPGTDGCIIACSMPFIRRIVPLTQVCRRGHELGSACIAQTLAKVKPCIEQRADGGIDKLLIDSMDSLEKAEAGYLKDCTDYVRLCIKLLGDINATRYTAPNEVSCWHYGKETLLTRAIKGGYSSQITTLLTLGADPHQPNARGEMPIDVAFEKQGPTIGAILKENGGDLFDFYRYDGPNAVRCKERYGWPRSLALLRRQRQSDPNRKTISTIMTIIMSKWNYS